MSDWVDVELLEDIEAFLARSGMKPSRFGRAVMNDSELVPGIANGRSVGAKNRQKIYEFINRTDVDAALSASPAEDAA